MQRFENGNHKEFIQNDGDVTRLDIVLFYTLVSDVKVFLTQIICGLIVWRCLSNGDNDQRKYK